MSNKKHQVIRDISYVRYLNNEVISQVLENKGITDLQTSYGNIIFTLLKYDKLTMKDLADEIKRDRSTLTVLIRKLEKNGYVKREENPDDARSKYVSLTVKALDLEYIFKEVSCTINECIWADIDEKEVEIFLKVLDKIKINLEKKRGKNG